MSQAENLLNNLTEPVYQHKHPVPDSDTHFLIDPYTRQIENTNYQKTVLMRGDHNSERFTFELPRYVDGHDMSLCNRVIVHFDNVGESIYDVNSDVAYTDDLRLNPDNPETVICSWLIRREATQIVGILSFSLQYLCVEDDGSVSYEWNTDSYDEIEIRKSKNNSEAAIINYTNVLEEWRSKIFGAGDSVMANITNEGAAQVAAVQNESTTQQAAIELKGSETLATIPGDYTEVYNMATEAVRTKADGIICEAEGETIEINDSSDDYIRGLNVLGKSTQATTTGKNLLAVTSPSRTTNGVTFTVRDDGSIHVKGTSAGNTWFSPGYTLTNDPDKMTFLPAGTYILSGNPTNSLTGYINGWYADDNTATPQINDNGEGGQVFTFDRDAYIIYQIMIAPNKTVDTILYPQIEVGETATAFEPYTGGVPAPNPEYPQEIVSVETPIVEVCGENLARSSRDGSITSMGLTVTQFNNSSEIVINGTSTSATSITVFRDICLPVGQYTLSVYGLNVLNTSYDRAYVMDGSSVANVNYVQPNRPQTFNITKPSIVSISIVFAEATSYSNQTIKFQLERGSVATDYKPYTGKRITLSDTLHGIPVTSGGNYTDENGQQWVCDEVDLERGVHIKRINVVQLTGTETTMQSAENWQRDGMYSAYVAPFTSSDQYGLDTPEAMTKCLSTHAIPNGWEWTVSNRLDNVGVRKNIVHLSFNNDVTGIVDEDDSTTKLTRIKTYLAAQHAAGTPVTVSYPLATPVETPLTAEEIEAYKSIKTNYPNTTVTNDSGAMMKIKYNADTKIYVDNHSVSEDRIAQAIADYMANNQIPSGSIASISTVDLIASKWVDISGNLHSQVVSINGVTENSQVDLTPSVEQLVVFYEKDLTFVTENDGGNVTVYAIGQKPENDYTIQVTITEVSV